MGTSTEGGFLAGVPVLATGLPLLLVQILIIVTVSRLIGALFVKCHQPRVIAEILAGILLGPTCFGQFHTFSETIFPEDGAPVLYAVANLGLLFFMFIIGLELDLHVFKENARRSIAISLAGIALPFGLGAAIAVFLYKRFMEAESVSFGTFVLFIGVAMSITAFPVLARIITELKLLGSPVGAAVIAAGAVDDAIAWLLIAIVITIMHASSGLNALYVVLMALGLHLFMETAVHQFFKRYIVKRWVTEDGDVHEGAIVLALLTAMLAGFATQTIGVHQIFGAFVAGSVMPRDNGFAYKVIQKIEDFVMIVLLPLYFAYSGLHTDLTTMNDGASWGAFVLVLLCACLGKVIGCASTAKGLGMPWRESWAVGILMNTKGLIELIVLNIGLEGNVINTKIFSIMLLMAISTTCMTTPLVQWVYPTAYQAKALAEQSARKAEASLPSATSSSSMLLLLPNMRSVSSIMSWIQMTHPARAHAKEEAPTTIHALRLMTLTEKSSAIMMALAKKRTMREDPLLNVLAAFGHLHHVHFKNHLAVSSPSQFAKDAAQIAQAKRIGTIIVPWGFSHHYMPAPVPETDTAEDKTDAPEHTVALTHLFKHPAVPAHSLRTFASPPPPFPIATPAFSLTDDLAYRVLRQIPTQRVGVLIDRGLDDTVSNVNIFQKPDQASAEKPKSILVIITNDRDGFAALELALEMMQDAREAHFTMLFLPKEDATDPSVIVNMSQTPMDNNNRSASDTAFARAQAIQSQQENVVLLDHRAHAVQTTDGAKALIDDALQSMECVLCVYGHGAHLPSTPLPGAESAALKRVLQEEALPSSAASSSPATSRVASALSSVQRWMSSPFHSQHASETSGQRRTSPSLPLAVGHIGVIFLERPEYGRLSLLAVRAAFE